jgi:hypothetical protein
MSASLPPNRSHLLLLRCGVEKVFFHEGADALRAVSQLASSALLFAATLYLVVSFIGLHPVWPVFFDIAGKIVVYASGKHDGEFYRLVGSHDRKYQFRELHEYINLSHAFLISKKIFNSLLLNLNA